MIIGTHEHFGGLQPYQTLRDRFGIKIVSIDSPVQAATNGQSVTIRYTSAVIAALLVPIGAVAADPAPDRGGRQDIVFGSPDRFDEQGGESIYRHVCAGCHMPDGKGASGIGGRRATGGSRLSGGDRSVWPQGDASIGPVSVGQPDCRSTDACASGQESSNLPRFSAAWMAMPDWSSEIWFADWLPARLMTAIKAKRSEDFSNSISWRLSVYTAISRIQAAMFFVKWSRKEMY